MQGNSKPKKPAEPRTAGDDRKTRAGGARGSAEAPVAEAADVAAYIMEIVLQLESMAVRSRLDLLAYFLRLAHLEARSAVREAQHSAEEELDQPSRKSYSTGHE